MLIKLGKIDNEILIRRQTLALRLPDMCIDARLCTNILSRNNEKIEDER